MCYIRLVYLLSLVTGWLMTVQEYYDQYVLIILRNMIQYLSQYEEVKFVWSEAVYLEQFYRKDATDLEKSHLKR